MSIYFTVSILLMGYKSVTSFPPKYHSQLRTGWKVHIEKVVGRCKKILNINVFKRLGIGGI